MAKKNKNEITIRSSDAEYLTYVASVGGEESSVEMRYEDENIWLTQKMMAVLYGVSISAINQHLKRIFVDGELIEAAVIKKYLITADDGKKYKTNHYNLRWSMRSESVYLCIAIPRIPPIYGSSVLKKELCLQMNILTVS